MPHPLRRLSLAGLIVLWAGATATAQPADVANGRLLAETWCIGCHVVAADQTAPVPAGPPTFPALAADPDATAERLSGFIRDPHPPMPDMSLTRQEVADLVAYIQSLAN